MSKRKKKLNRKEKKKNYQEKKKNYKEKKKNDKEKGNIRIVRGREEESLVEGVMVRKSIIGWDG